MYGTTEKERKKHKKYDAKLCRLENFLCIWKFYEISCGVSIVQRSKIFSQI